jgi:hypothetical protein
MVDQCRDEAHLFLVGQVARQFAHVERPGSGYENQCIAGDVVDKHLRLSVEAGQTGYSVVDRHLELSRIVVHHPSAECDRAVVEPDSRKWLAEDFFITRAEILEGRGNLLHRFGDGGGVTRGVVKEPAEEALTEIRVLTGEEWFDCEIVWLFVE